MHDEHETNPCLDCTNADPNCFYFNKKCADRVSQDDEQEESQ